MLLVTILSAAVDSGDAVVLLVGPRTSDLQVAGSIPGWAPLCSGLGVDGRFV